MVYIMNFHVDGGCRGNGHPWAIGVAACVLKTRYKHFNRTHTLARHYVTPTSQRAELVAIIIALKWALEKYDQLHFNPALSVRIYSDSQYAVGCMSDWIYKWSRNGWRNARGNDVANRDLIQRASYLDDQVAALGSVQYIWVSRWENEDADGLCRDKLDELENHEDDDNDDDDWW